MNTRNRICVIFFSPKSAVTKCHVCVRDLNRNAFGKLCLFRTRGARSLPGLEYLYLVVGSVPHGPRPGRHARAAGGAAIAQKLRARSIRNLFTESSDSKTCAPSPQSRFSTALDAVNLLCKRTQKKCENCLFLNIVY